MEVFIISKFIYEVNGSIRDAAIRLIGQNGEQMGVMSAYDANKIASAQGLDLVKISPYTLPPVCKIMDYSKFCYEQKKRKKEMRKKHKIVEIKEIQMSPNIGDHDFDTKLRSAKKFLEAGHRVKASVRFRGRELTHVNIGQELLQRFIDGCSGISTYEHSPTMQGKNLIVTLVPEMNL